MIINLTTNEISAIYYTAIKDRLYCDEEHSNNRLGAQFVLYQLINLLTQSIAPIVPHLAEEVYLHLPECLKTSAAFFTRLQHLTPEKSWQNEEVKYIMDLLLNVRKDINKQTNAGEALESKVEILMNPDNISLIQKHGNLDDLCDVLQVSEVIVTPSVDEKFTLRITKGEQFKCARCRKFTALMPQTLCDRCYSVVENIKTRKQIPN